MTITADAQVTPPADTPLVLAATPPTQIDERLSEIFTRYYAARGVAAQLEQQAAQTRAMLDPNRRGGGWRSPEQLTAALAVLTGKIAEKTAVANAILSETAPLDAEFTRRGGWTRAFLVDNGKNGHVHSSMHCHTCWPTTEFLWVTELSAADEATIVDEAGKAACTACYGTAPVGHRHGDSRIEAPARKAAREAAAQAKAARDGKRLAAAIRNPDGTELREVTTRYSQGMLTDATADGSVIATENAAYRRATTDLFDAAWYGADHPSQPAWQLTASRCIVAVVHKRDVNPTGLRAEIDVKVTKKLKEWGRG